MVLPGGGYQHLAEHEGKDIAEFLSAAGFDCGVLSYRLAPDHRHPDMLQDAQRGMRMMRAAEAIRCKNIAVLGFSAGGHLAGSLSVHHDQLTSKADDLSETYSARPDAAVLCYPVIAMRGEHVHEGSRNNLLGEDPGEDDLKLMDLHRHVDADTPPTFLWHTAEDAGVPAENSLMYATALLAHDVPAELHLYEQGKHGLGLAEGMPAVSSWIELAMMFLDRYLNEVHAD
jgi:acetyl esterase/lipase